MVPSDGVARDRERTAPAVHAGAVCIVGDIAGRVVRDDVLRDSGGAVAQVGDTAAATRSAVSSDDVVGDDWR